MKLPLRPKPYWIESYRPKPFGRLEDDLEVDTVVIGGGIAGLTTAYLLSHTGQTVAVLEKDRIGTGVTGHTTGKVSSQHDYIYHTFAERFGDEAARTYGAANEAAIDEIESIIEREGIECDWQRDDNYVFTEQADKVDELKEEAETARRLGLPASFEPDTPLPFPVRAAVKFSNQAHFHSRKYVDGLAHAVERNGGYVFEQTKAQYVKDGRRVRVKTRSGTVQAHHAVLATHVPKASFARLTYALREAPQTSYLVAGKPKDEFGGMYISHGEPHRSILPIGSGGNRLVLVGGESHLPTVLFDERRSRYRNLAHFAAERFGVEQIEYRWMNFDYYSYDGLPLIGKLYPWSRRVYVATGFRKWGLTNGTVAGMILADRITGNKNPWTRTFDPNRSKLRRVLK